VLRRWEKVDDGRSDRRVGDRRVGDRWVG